MSETKTVLLEKAVTYKGVDYAPGRNEMPAEAADLAVQKKLGVLDEESAESKDSPAKSDETFESLTFEETMRRFEKNDFSDQVLKSIQANEKTVKEFRQSGMSLEEYLKHLKAEDKFSGNLPEDLPMRHVFAKLGHDYDSVEKIKPLSRDDLINLNGIAEGSADKIIAYLADKK